MAKKFIRKKKKKAKKAFVLHDFLVGRLRLASNLIRKYHLTSTYDEVFDAARVHYGKYKCAKCKNVFDKQTIQVDHIHPVVPVTGFDNWDGYISRLFCDAEGLQILCKPCHKQKSVAENKERRLHAKS
jgi:5-methylcytosine-specific restriction endonuclease McrA